MPFQHLAREVLQNLNKPSFPHHEMDRFKRINVKLTLRICGNLAWWIIDRGMECSKACFVDHHDMQIIPLIGSGRIYDEIASLNNYVCIQKSGHCFCYELIGVLFGMVKS
jgi:hypothetical protein